MRRHFSRGPVRGRNSGLADTLAEQPFGHTSHKALSPAQTGLKLLPHSRTCWARGCPCYFATWQPHMGHATASCTTQRTPHRRHNDATVSHLSDCQHEMRPAQNAASQPIICQAIQPVIPGRRGCSSAPAPAQTGNLGFFPFCGPRESKTARTLSNLKFNEV